MQDKRATTGTGGGLVYVVVCGQDMIPLLRIPTIGTIAVYDNTSDKFIEGTISWDLNNDKFRFIKQP